MSQQTPSTNEKRNASRRMATLLDRTLPVPVASLMASALHRQRSSDSGSLGHAQPKGQPQGTRFCTTKTGDQW
jgi:hypothetical protein